MPTQADLLLEKRRYGLKEELSEWEITQLKQGFPVQKIMGYVQFDEVKIDLRYHVLIPRYETEEVVQVALKYIKPHSRVLDLGTGSGYIGLSVKAKTNAEVVMSDIDPQAILQSRFNARLNQLKVKVVQSDLFNNLQGKFDVIISNPPYLNQAEPLAYSVIAFEPHHALFAPEQGNHFYKLILRQAPAYLNKGGVLVLEIGPDNVAYLEQQNCQIILDINQKPRIALKFF